MRKLLYALCLFAFVACSDNDDEKVITDFDKPYGNRTSAELTELIEGNIRSCVELYKEISEHTRETNRELQEVIDHYGPLGLENILPSLTRSTALETNGTEGFTGVRLTWNREKQDFDTTINANGFMSVLLPSSVTDDSRNNLEIVFTVDRTSGLHVTQKVFKDGQLLYALTHQETSSGETSITGEYPPYHIYTKRTQASNDIVSRIRVTINEINFSKEGGSSYLFRQIPIGNNTDITVEYNNVRLHTTFLQFEDITTLLNDLYDREDLCDELIQANTRQNIVVFTDRDEKIGEWIMSIRWYGDSNFNLWKCMFKDGTEHEFPLFMPSARFV